MLVNINCFLNVGRPIFHHQGPLTSSENDLDNITEAEVVTTEDTVDDIAQAKEKDVQKSLAQLLG